MAARTHMSERFAYVCLIPSGFPLVEDKELERDDEDVERGRGEERFESIGKKGGMAGIRGRARVGR